MRRGPPRCLFGEALGESRWVTLGGVVLTVNGDGALVERQLAGGELACPGCGGVLGGWGHARLRPVRVLDGSDAGLVPRRSRCRQCGATHVLLQPRTPTTRAPPSTACRCLPPF